MVKVNTVLQKYLEDETLSKTEIGKGAKSLKHLLNKLDAGAEVVPENNLDMFSRLIRSLKNDELTPSEQSLIKEIVEYK